MVISLDARSQPAYEIGAQLDALLCYPSFSPERQLRIANAICAKLMRGWIALEPERREELQPLRRDYAVAANRASLATLEKRRRQVICPRPSGPSTMIVWTTKGTTNAEQEAQAGRDYRQAA